MDIFIGLGWLTGLSGIPAEFFDNRRRIANTGFARHVHQQSSVEDADGVPGEHRVAGTRISLPHSHPYQSAVNSVFVLHQ
jgi:hypothetical protein